MACVRLWHHPSMGLRLIVMRYAKSSWKSDAPTDHERPLNKRGRRDAPRVGSHLRELGWRPESIVSSDSVRTTETFARMAPALSGEQELRVVFTRSLYHAGVSKVRAALRQLPDEVTTAMVLGHNPGWEEVVEWLTGESVSMPTACAALLQNPATSWPDSVSDKRSWQLVDVIRPREFS